MQDKTLVQDRLRLKKRSGHILYFSRFALSLSSSDTKGCSTRHKVSGWDTLCYLNEDEDGNGQFTDSVHYITVELPKFRKTLSKLTTPQDFMLYLLKNSREMKEIPKEFVGKGFDKLLETCKFVNMTEIEQREYISRMKAEWDREGQLNYAESRGREEGREQGREQGREEERLKNARAMKADGLPTDAISKYTGLTPEQIAQL